MGIGKIFERIADEVFEKGKEKECKKLWSVIQQNGQPTDYVSAFYGANWTDEIYDPQYDFVVKRKANNMYFASSITSTKKPIDITSDEIISNTNSMFQNAANLKEIVLLKLREDGTNSLSKNFDGCTSLVTINIEGKIGKSTSFADCPLSVKSLKNIIEHLMDYTGKKEYVYTVTFKTSAFDEIEKEGATAKYNGTACTWAELINNKKWNLVKV